MLLFLIPILLFVICFLYETYLSIIRLKKPESGKSGYLSATWEVTHTLLIFALIMLFMMFTQNIDGLASAIFTCAFIAALALIVRAIIYLYIFYVRKKNTINLLDWAFMLCHIIAAVFLVATVIKALLYIYKNNPPVNSQFIPYMLPGLIATIVICIVPIAMLYSTKK